MKQKVFSNEHRLLGLRETEKTQIQIRYQNKMWMLTVKWVCASSPDHPHLRYKNVFHDFRIFIVFSCQSTANKVI